MQIAMLNRITTISSKASIFKVATFSAMALVGLTAQAQSPLTFPTKTVEITVPYPPGGGVDTLARLIGAQLEKTGQAVVVENRPGAGGTIAARYVISRPKDGHSLLMMNDAYSLAPAVYKTLPYDPKTALEAVINVAWAPMLVLVPGDSRHRTLAHVVAEGKRPGANMSFGSCGTGTEPHLAGEMLNLAFDMHVVHVPYKGCAPALVDVMGGQVSFGVITISAALPYLRSGRLRALAITSKERSKVVPSVPTVAESGAPGYELSQWQGMAVPAGTPEETKQAIYRTVSLMMKTDPMHSQLIELGYTPADDNPTVFQKIVNDDIGRFSDLAKKIGLKPE